MFASPAQIAFSLGNIDIRWYGITMAVAMLAGICVIFLIKKKYFENITFDEICDISFILIISGILSARFYYVILDYKFFMRNPFEIFAINHGGIAIQGALLGGVIAGLLYSKKHNISFLRYADLFSFGIITGQIIGRWGNFFNSEAFGLPTDLPWKLYIPYALRPLEYKNFEFFHPTFLYESLLDLLILIVLFCILKYKKDRPDGFIFLLYIILYSCVRILIETFRTDSVLNIGCFHIAHIASFVFIIAAGVSLFVLFRSKKNINL